MEKLDKIVMVNIDRELCSWLDEKVSRGYKKGSLIRHILRKQMEFERGLKVSGGAGA